MHLRPFSLFLDRVEIKIPRGNVSEFAKIELVVGEFFGDLQRKCEKILTSVVYRHEQGWGVAFDSSITALKRFLFGPLNVEFDIIYLSAPLTTASSELACTSVNFAVLPLTSVCPTPEFRFPSAPKTSVSSLSQAARL